MNDLLNNLDCILKKIKPKTMKDLLNEYIEKYKLYMEHKTLEEALAAGKEAYARNNFGEAINHFGEAKRLAPDSKEADQWLTMIDEILAFRHKDYYNP